jgi:hypothetical protein
MPRAGEPLGGARLHATGNAADLRRALALSPTPAAPTGGRLIYQADGWLAMVAAVDKKRPFKLVAMFRPENVTTQSATPTARMASFAGTSSFGQFEPGGAERRGTDDAVLCRSHADYAMVRLGHAGLVKGVSAQRYARAEYRLH